MMNIQHVSTFGHIYHNGLINHLKKMGNTFSMLRKTRREDIETVANAINIRPDTLEKIENGEQDFRLKTFYALCDYYDIDMEPLVGKGQTVHIIITDNSRA